MSTHGSMTRLIRRLGSDSTGDRNEAARLIWERYFHALLALARDNLHPRIRRRESEEDVLQDMYFSFCRRQQRGDFDLADRDELWRLLAWITLCKVRNAANRHSCQGRDISLEQPWQVGDEPGGLGPGLEAVRDRGPDPAEAAVLNEALELRLKALDDPRLRSVALMKLEGWTNAEIAAAIGRTERCVEQQLKRIRERWGRTELDGNEPLNESHRERCGS